jgi:hypothetical protein
MTFDLVIISVSERAVQCALEDGSPAFWLPRQKVEWRGALDPGALVSAEIPRWVALKHRQLVESRVSTQKVLDLHKVELDPTIASKEGSFPMSDYPTDAGKGALFRNEKREKPSHPEFRGDCTVTIAGVERKLWISAWVKTSEKTGKKFFSLAFREAEAPKEQRQQQPDRQQQRPAGGQSFGDSDIPFGPEWR